MLYLSFSCTQDSCSALHAAVSSGHVDALKLLLYHPSPEAETGGSVENIDTQQTHPKPVMTHHTLNLANQDGWTAAHIAASRGYKVMIEYVYTWSLLNTSCIVLGFNMTARKIRLVWSFVCSSMNE